MIKIRLLLLLCLCCCWLAFQICQTSKYISLALNLVFDSILGDDDIKSASYFSDSGGLYSSKNVRRDASDRSSAFKYRKGPNYLVSWPTRIVDWTASGYFPNSEQYKNTSTSKRICCMRQMSTEAELELLIGFRAKLLSLDCMEESVQPVKWLRVLINWSKRFIEISVAKKPVAVEPSRRCLDEVIQFSWVHAYP